MARYVLLQFDNNEDAEQFVEGVKKDAEEFGDQAVMAAVGLFAKPTNFCDHEPVKGGGARGKTFGWYVGRCCNRARRGRQFMRNLLFDPSGDILDSDIYVVSKEGM